MTELPLDDDQRDAFAGHLDCVGVTELVRREPSPDAGRHSGVSQQRADPGRGAGAAAGGPAEHAEAARLPAACARMASHGSSCSQAQRSIPTSRRLPPFPRRTSTAPRVLSRSLSAKASASLTLNPARHSTTITPRSLNPVGAIAGGVHHRDDLLHGRRVGWITQSFVPGRPALMKSRQSRGRAGPAGAVQRWRGMHDVLLGTVA